MLCENELGNLKCDFQDRRDQPVLDLSIPCSVARHHQFYREHQATPAKVSRRSAACQPDLPSRHTTGQQSVNAAKSPTLSGAPRHSPMAAPGRDALLSAYTRHHAMHWDIRRFETAPRPCHANKQ